MKQLHLAITSAATSIGGTIYGYVTLSNISLLIAIIAGLVSICASFGILPTYKKKKS